MDGNDGRSVSRRQALRITAVTGASLALGGGLVTGLLRRAGLHRVSETRTQMGTVVIVTVVDPALEVARSMVAKPGGLGLLGLGVQFYGSPRIVATIRPGAFYPPPKVTSAVVRIDLHSQPLLPPSKREGFFALARAAFSAPRKQLRGGLSHALNRPADAVADLLRRGGVDPTRRPQTLALDEWAALYRVFREAGWLK